MKKKELVKTLMERMQKFGYFPSFTNVKIFIQEYEKLAKPEPQAGHAEEAPRYVRNVIARLRELPSHDREVWLKAIMGEFEQDFSHAKWREGYEQGKFEGAWVGEQLKDADKIRRELNRPVVKQFVADWYEKHKNSLEFNMFDYVYQFDQNEESDLKDWFNDINTKPLQTLVNMHQFGYTVEEEKRYYIRLKNVDENYNYLNFIKHLNAWVLAEIKTDKKFRTTHTRKELEDAGFGWIFSCEGIEVEEVE